jgi:hypothetical protein
MATKKTTTKAKYYIVMDSDGNIICQGEWDEVKEQLEEYMTGDYNDKKFIADLTIHEIGAGKKLKYIPAIPASVEL